MEPTEFRRYLYEELVEEFTAVRRIRKFTRNSAVIGAHAEAVVRTFIESTIQPLRVSTGAVIHETLCGDDGKAPQVDSMIWFADPTPAVFERGGFALVPKQSCYGILEIKTSCYSGVGRLMAKVIDRADDLVREGSRLYWNSQPLFPALGVVCVRLDGQTMDSELQRLISQEKAVVLATQNGDEVVPDIDGMITLVNCLSAIRTWALHKAGDVRVLPENRQSFDDVVDPVPPSGFGDTTYPGSSV